MASKQAVSSPSPKANAKKEDIWATNIHLIKTHDDAAITIRLQDHHKFLSENDKFVDFIKHVENQKQQTFKDNLTELKVLGSSGAF